MYMPELDRFAFDPIVHSRDCCVMTNTLTTNFSNEHMHTNIESRWIDTARECTHIYGTFEQMSIIFILRYRDVNTTF